MHEALVFGDAALGGIGNVAGRSALGAVVSALDRVAFDGDRAQFVLLAGTYQPFVSLFNVTGVESVYGIRASRLLSFSSLMLNGAYSGLRERARHRAPPRLSP